MSMFGAMPEIDLKPDDYRVQTRNGNWQSREKLIPTILGSCIGISLVVFVWWNRAEIALASMFGLACMMSFAIGLMVAGWAKRFD